MGLPAYISANWMLIYLSSPLPLHNLLKRKENLKMDIPTNRQAKLRGDMMRQNPVVIKLVFKKSSMPITLVLIMILRMERACPNRSPTFKIFGKLPASLVFLFLYLVVFGFLVVHYYL